MNNIIFGDRFVSVSDSLYITAISMSIVFSVLVLICFFVACMKYIPQAKAVKNTAVKEVQKPTRISEQAGNEQEINYEDENIRLALMVASMEAVAEEENAWIKIRSVREII